MPDDGPSDELQEVEEELVNKKSEGSHNDDVDDLESASQGKEKPKTGLFSWCGLGSSENVKVFTQVKRTVCLISMPLSLLICSSTLRPSLSPFLLNGVSMAI